MLTKFAWVPNALSICRIPLSVLYIAVFSTTEDLGFWLAVGITLLALVTDFADGWLSRKWQVTSETGYFLDGLGDKSFTVAICLSISNAYPHLSVLVWALISREVGLYALRAIDADRKNSLKNLRWVSLVQAGFIRVFFLTFFVLAYRELHSLERVEWLTNLFVLSGAIATIAGWTSIFALTNKLVRQTTDN